MPIAIALLGIVVQALGNAGRQQQDVERRSEALTNGQIQLERMTRELRGADWVYFRSSSVVDLAAHVRATATSRSVVKLVRYDCSTEVCTRSEGAATSYPPPSVPTFTKTATVIGDASTDVGGRNGQITGHDVFEPRHVDPATGRATTDFLNPDFLFVRLQLKLKNRPEPTVLEDGVSLRNRTNYAG